MQKNNVSYIYLLGFPSLDGFSYLLFFILLIIYCITICGNVIIIILVTANRTLHSPMYFFITLISLLDIIIATAILPNLLHLELHEGVTMSLDACISQLYVIANSETSECLILMVMSYDRYVAICNPLRYNSIMKQMFCVWSVIASWLLSSLMNLLNEITTYNLDFCGPNVIDHFFCDLSPVLELSCSDILVFQLQTILISIIVVIGPFIMILVSYVYIISTILNIPSISGQQKAFSTCSSHLMAVLIFYGSLFTVYIVPTKGKFLTINKVFSLLYTVVTPLLNPFIYSLRNKDIKIAFERLKHTLN